jgi:hypothetical protein
MDRRSRDERSRREILEAFLGLPFALLAGCGTSRAGKLPPLPPGEIVGAAQDAGHLLRAGAVAIPRLPTSDCERAEVVIIGSGVAGLSAAWRLARADFHDFVVLELEHEFGGNSKGGESSGIGASPGLVYPWGAHYVPLPLRENRALVTLLDELGALERREGPDGEPEAREELLCREPDERIFYKGRWYPGLYLHAGATREDLDEWRAFHDEIDRWVAWRDARGRRAFALPIAESSDDAELVALDRVDFSDWITQRGWRSPRLRWFLDYACRDDYGLRLEDTSAWAGIFYFASRQRDARSEPRPLIAWPEGNARLVAHLSRGLGARLRAGLLVHEIDRDAALDSDAASGRQRYRVRAVERVRQKAREWSAASVIFAAPQFLRRFIIRAERDDAPQWLGALQHAPWMVANLHLSARPRERDFPRAWDNVLYESPSLGYICATHQAGRDHGPTVLTYYFPLCAADPRRERERLLSLDRAGWAEVALADLERAHPELRNLVTRIDVQRWGHAMAQPRPGLVRHSGRRDALRAKDGIHFAHSDLSGLSLFEEAFYHGIRAAEELLASRGIPFATIL